MPPALQEPAGADGNGADGFASPPGSSALTFEPSHMSPDVSLQIPARRLFRIVTRLEVVPRARAQPGKLWIR